MTKPAPPENSAAHQTQDPDASGAQFDPGPLKDRIRAILGTKVMTVDEVFERLLAEGGIYPSSNDDRSLVAWMLAGNKDMFERAGGRRRFRVRAGYELRGDAAALPGSHDSATSNLHQPTEVGATARLSAVPGVLPSHEGPEPDPEMKKDMHMEPACDPQSPRTESAPARPETPQPSQSDEQKEAEEFIAEHSARPFVPTIPVEQLRHALGWALKVGGELHMCSDETDTGGSVLWVWARQPSSLCAVRLEWYRDVPVRARLNHGAAQAMLAQIKSITGNVDLTYEPDGVILAATKWLAAPEINPPSWPQPSPQPMTFLAGSSAFKGAADGLVLHWHRSGQSLRYGPASSEHGTGVAPLPYVLNLPTNWPDADLAFEFNPASVRLLDRATKANTTVFSVVEHGAGGDALWLSVRSERHGIEVFTVVSGKECPIPPSPLPERTVIDLMADIDRGAEADRPDAAPEPQQLVAEVVIPAPEPLSKAPTEGSAAPVTAPAVAAVEPQQPVADLGAPSAPHESASEADLQRAYDRICEMVRGSERARDEIDSHVFWTQVDSCYEASLLYRELTQIRRGTRVRDASGVPVPAFPDKFGRDVGVSASTVRIWLYCSAIPAELRAQMPEPLLRHTRLCRDLARLKGSIDEFAAVIRAFQLGGYKVASEISTALLRATAEGSAEDPPLGPKEDEPDDEEAERKARAAQSKRHSKKIGAKVELVTGEEHVEIIEGIKLTFRAEPMVVGRSELEALLRASDDLQVRVSGMIRIYVEGKLKR